ncbi:MAG: hypothetical protein Q8873_05690 [Bacillota bacterium]|nr:hypothetical protein [Bacillota bacterium]
MKFFRSSLAILICITTIFACLGMSVYADGNIVVSLGTVETTPGLTISVPVNVSGGSNLISGAFCVEYDSNNLTYTGYTEGNISSLTQIHADSVAVGTNAVGIIFSTENANVAVTEAGTIINLNFTVADDASNATTGLTFNLVRPDDPLVEGGISDADGMIDATYTNGGVEINNNSLADVALSYQVSYDGENYGSSTSVTQLKSKQFQSQTYTFDRTKDYAYIKYSIVSDGLRGDPVVEVKSSTGTWSIGLDNYVAKIPMSILSGSAENPSAIVLTVVADMETTDTSDDINMKFAINTGTSNGGTTYVGDYINAEVPTNIAAQTGIGTYDDQTYNIDVYYAIDAQGNLTTTKIWTAKAGGTVDYNYDFQTCELTTDNISQYPTSTNVQFNVFPLDANVTLGGNIVTAVNGVAVFEDVAFGVTDYSVEAEGYTTQTGTVNVINGVDPVNVELASYPYSNVTFYVNPDGSEVTFNNETVTVQNGSSVINDVPFGTYEYTIVHDGYETHTGTAIVDKANQSVSVDLTGIQTTSDVVFNVTPATAIVTMNGNSVAAVGGVATFNDVAFGTYNYTVSATGYTNKTGSVDVATNMSPVTVSLNQITTKDVTFNVTPATATVTMNGNSVTAVGGVATFKDVDFGTYNYTVSATGYTDKTGSVNVAANTNSVTVSLVQITTKDVTFNVTPATATVTMNGNSVTAVGGVATFNDVVFGSYDYSVSATDYETKTGTATVEYGMSAITVSLTAITYTNVVFDVTPETATVTMNGSSITAVSGVATFTNVEYGSYDYSVSATGYDTQTGTATVEKDMSAITVTLQQTVIIAPTPTLVGFGTYDYSYDADTQTITVRALNTNTSGGIAIVIPDVASLSEYTTDTGNNITPTVSGDNKQFVAEIANGTSQTFNIYAQTSTTKFTYVVNFSFIDDPTVVKPYDILTLRAYSAGYSVADRKIYIDSDLTDTSKRIRASSSTGAAVYGGPGVTTKYTYVSDNGGAASIGRVSIPNTDKYKSLLTGQNWETGGGIYGAQRMAVVPRANGTCVYVNVTLTKGAYSTTYEMCYRLTDFAVQGDVNISSIIGLRTKDGTITYDNTAKTIYYETYTTNTSAGFAVNVNNGLTKDTRPRRTVIAASGYGCAYGDITTDGTDGTVSMDQYDRYVVARQANGLEQTFPVKIFGGEDGRTYTVYNVTVKFLRAYAGDIPLTDLKTGGTDSCTFDDATNTFTVNYSGDSATIAPVYSSDTTTRQITVATGTIKYNTKLNGRNGYAVKKADGVNQTIYITVYNGFDSTTYTVNLNYVGA